MPEPPPTETRHQSGGLAVALASLDLDALTVADALADVAATAGENVTTAIRADLKEFRAETHSRLDTLRAETRSWFETLGAETRSRMDTLGGETCSRMDTLDARHDTLANSIQSLQRELGNMRWMIGAGFTLLGILMAFSTFLRA